MTLARRVLVAGLGNLFFGDDGFGPAVLGRLASERLPAGIEARDFGIASLHLAYRIAEGIDDTVILVDAIARGDAPGTLSLIDLTGPGLSGPDLSGPDLTTGPGLDGHSVSPASVLSTVAALGAPMPRTLLVGCEPESFEQGMALSPPVVAALGRAVALVVARALAELDPAAASEARGGG